MSVLQWQSRKSETGMSANPANFAKKQEGEPEISRLAKLARGADQSYRTKISKLAKLAERPEVNYPASGLSRIGPTGQSDFDPSHFAAALARLEHDEHVPAAYKMPWARFQSTLWPDIDLNRRDELIADAGVFLDAWATHAAGSEWSAADLFDRPRGLIWRLQGRKVAALGWRCYRLEGDAKLSEFGGADGPQ